MPLDTSIALQGRPVKLDDPLEAQAKQAQLKSLLMQQQQAEQAINSDRQLNDAYRSSMGASGQIDRNMLLSTLAKGGIGSKIPGLQKQFAESDQAQAKLSGEQFDLAKKQLDASDAALSALISKGNQVSHQDVIGVVSNLVSNGLMDANKGAELVRSAPGRPEALPGWLVQKGLMVADAKTRLDASMPKFEYKDTGGQLTRVDVNPFTNQGSPAQLTKTNTPDALLSSSTTMRGQDVSAATARRGQDITAASAAADRNQRGSAGATAIEKDAAGNLILINKGNGVANPVTDANGKPLNVGAGQNDAKEGLKLLDQAEPLLKSSTGSLSGKTLDIIGSAFGVATPGSISATKLKALEGALISKMPKMSGPQSDKDVAMYRQMAGEIGDDTVPYQRKLAAVQTVREILERNAGVAKGSSKPSGNVVDWGSL